jgi:hypothetical protein
LEKGFNAMTQRGVLCCDFFQSLQQMRTFIVYYPNIWTYSMKSKMWDEPPQKNSKWRFVISLPGLSGRLSSIQVFRVSNAARCDPSTLQPKAISQSHTHTHKRVIDFIDIMYLVSSCERMISVTLWTRWGFQRVSQFFCNWVDAANFSMITYKSTPHIINRGCVWLLLSKGWMYF